MLLAALCCLWARTCGTDGAKPFAEKPNIVILFADDLGWGDLSYYGHPTSSTPHLDQLASEGMVFTQFYSAAPVCSPSRAALMTGRYQVRSGIYPYVLRANSIGGLPHDETTLAELVKTVGYSTAHLGKWHLGVGESFQYLPTTQGFDYYLGVPYSTDMCPCFICFYPDVPCAPPGSAEQCHSDVVDCPLIENEEILQQPADLLTLTEKYVSAAKSIIKQNAAHTRASVCLGAVHQLHAQGTVWGLSGQPGLGRGPGHGHPQEGWSGEQHLRLLHFRQWSCSDSRAARW
jgi:arylsulfatase A